MPEIIIQSCGRTPNVDALEAIAETMRRNYMARTPDKDRTIRTASGRCIGVKHTPHDDSKSRCSCSFSVIRVNGSE